MTEMAHAYDWRNRVMLDADGDKIGTIEELYTDRDTGAPEWATVSTGLFGTKLTFVPLQGASPEGESVRVAVAKSQIKDAPHIDPGTELSQAEESQLYDHYGLDYGEARSESGLPEGGAGAGTEGDRDVDVDRDRGAAGEDVSGPTTDDAMTRSEEEQRVGKASREAGRARLRKCVVTEQVETTVPVQREEVRIEREPITDANVDAATSGADISEAEHEVVLHEEEPVVEKRAVPKERVRLDKDTVTEDRTVSDEVRREEIDADEGGRTR